MDAKSYENILACEALLGQRASKEGAKIVSRARKDTCKGGKTQARIGEDEDEDMTVDISDRGFKGMVVKITMHSLARRPLTSLCSSPSASTSSSSRFLTLVRAPYLKVNSQISSGIHSFYHGRIQSSRDVPGYAPCSNVAPLRS